MNKFILSISIFFISVSSVYGMMRLPAEAIRSQAVARVPGQLQPKSVVSNQLESPMAQLNSDQMARVLQDSLQEKGIKGQRVHRAPLSGGFKRTMPLLMRWEHRESPHDILGVDSFASEQEIKDSYKKLALQYHPDRGGNIEMFRKATEAKEYMLKNPRYQYVREDIDWRSVFGKYKSFFDNVGGTAFDFFEQYVLTDALVNELFKSAALMGSTSSMDKLLNTGRVTSDTVSDSFLITIATLQEFNVYDYLLKTGKVQEKYIASALVYVLFEQHNMYTASYLLDKASFQTQTTVLAMSLQEKRFDITEFLLPKIVNKFYQTHEPQVHALIKDYYYLLVAAGVITTGLIGKKIWNMYQAIQVGLAHRRIAKELGVDPKDIQQLEYDKDLKKWTYKLLSQARIPEKEV